jgi:plastocyanin
MSKRLLGSLIIAGVLAVLLFSMSVMFFSGNTQAQGQPSVALSVSAQGKDKAAGQTGIQNIPAGVWATVAPFPTVSLTPTPGSAPLKLKRAAAAAYPPNGKLYVLGGRRGVDGEDYPLSNIYEYTPGEPGTWVAKNGQIDPGLVGSRFTANMAVATLTDTTGIHIYAIGGSSTDSIPTTSVRVYDPILDSVSVLSSDPWPLSTAHSPGGWAVYNNQLYIFGGFSALGSGAVFSDTWRFNPLAAPGAKWTQLTTANLPTAKGYTAGAMLDGYIYAIGGDSWDSANHTLVPLTDVVRMDPTQANPTWTAVAGLPTARGDMGAWAYDTGAPYEIAGRVAVAGGHYLTPDNLGYIYNPGTDSWSSFPNMVKATRNYGYAQLNGYLYAFGGYDFTNSLPDAANFNQRYDATGPASTSTPTVTGTPPTSTRTSTTGATSTGTMTAVVTASSTSAVTGTATTCAALSEGFESGTLGQFSSVVAQCVPGGCGWTSTTSNPHSGTRSAFAPDLANITDQYLQLTAPFSPIAGSQLIFWHSYDLEDTFDGGVLEASTNGGTTWTDMAANMSGNTYTDLISSSFGSPISGRQAWSGVSGGYVQTTVNLTPYAGQNLLIRFRLATDNSVAAQGWNIDDISVTSVCSTGTPATATRTVTVVATSTQTQIAASSTPVATATCIPAGTIHAVSIQDFSFNPQEMTIPAGTTVRWTNTGSAPHTSTSDTAVWDSGTLNQGDQYSRTFNTPGTYTYHCELHPSMTGTITVVAAALCPTSTPVPPTVTNTTAPTSTRTATGTAVVTATSTACTVTFTDVQPDNVFYPFIRCLVCRGVISGYDDGTFRPFNDVTRGQIAKMVSNAAGFDDDPGVQLYEDVPPGSPFYIWINRLSNRGHMGGYPCGLLPEEPCIEPGNMPYFRPSNSATRGQLSKIVANAAGIDTTPSGIFYTDVPEEHPFYVWIMRLTQLGVMSGYDCGGEGEPCDSENRPYFRPYNNVTRGQASKIVANTFFPGCQTPAK